MSSHNVPHFSQWKRLQLLGAIASALVGTILTALVSFCVNQPKDLKTVKRLALSAASKNAIVKLSVRQLQYLQKPTGQTVVTFVRKHHLSHESVMLRPKDYAEATLHFIDCHSDDTNGRILLYFHGGGFIFPASPGSHLPFAHRCAQTAGAHLAVLEYTLAPTAKYPAQLAQAAAALGCLLEYRQPSQIIIGGDSAGGNLTLALLAHLRSPHPDIAPVSLLASPTHRLLGAICMSPRCSNDASTASYDYNRDKDIVGRESMSVFTANWQPAPNHIWAAPRLAEAALWDDLYANRILLVAGKDEVYVEDIKSVASAMGAKEDSKSGQSECISPGSY